MYSKGELEEIILKLLKKAETDLPGDLEASLEKARKEETGKATRIQLDAILKNIKCARKKGVPI